MFVCRPPGRASQLGEGRRENLRGDGSGVRGMEGLAGCAETFARCESLTSPHKPLDDQNYNSYRKKGRAEQSTGSDA